MIFPDRSLAIRLEKVLAQDMLSYVFSARQLYPGSKATYEYIGGGIAVYTGLDFINSTVAAGLDVPVSDDDMNKLEALFQKNSMISQVEICPFTSIDFLDTLHSRNYRIVRFFTAYTHSLQHLNTEYLNLNPDIMVKPVDAANKHIWIECVMDIQPGDTETDICLAQTAFNRQHVTCFVAWLDNKPVGASALSIRDGIALLHFTATRQKYHNQGIQTGMIQARLAYAKAAGCDMAFTTTVPGNNSMRNILRAGFDVAYSRCIMQKAF